MSSFAQFKLSKSVLDSIAKVGFTIPTPVQSNTIPTVLDGKDVVSLAETGSGKTAAYIIPVVEKSLSDPKHNTLILAPTRELALQIGDVVKTLTAHNSQIGYTVLIGGQPMFKQMKSLQRKPQIIIATPGRLIDHVGQRALDLKNITCFILDEADRMFDMGFAPQVNRIVQMIPYKRQTLMFSATFADDVRALAHRILKDPVEIEVRKTKQPPAVIEQKILEVPGPQKNDQLLDLINAAKGPVLVFTRTKNRTNKVSRYLEEYGVKVSRIHGDRSQAQRIKSIADFKSGKIAVLVATDIAARGLDVPNISDVINYDIPMTVDDYVHRIGRTGRAGQSGQALTMITPEDRKDWSYIAKKMNLPAPALPKNSGGQKQAQGNGQGQGQGKKKHHFRPKRQHNQKRNNNRSHAREF